MTLNPDDQTRTVDTEIAYRNRVARLLAQASREVARRVDPHLSKPVEIGLAGFIDWFSKENDRWAARTLRVYRSAIRFVVNEQIAAEELNAYEGSVLLSRLETAPVPKPKKSKPLTAARKRKEVPLNEYSEVIKRLGEGDALDRLTARFLAVNLRVGLRPVEWQRAALVGSEVIVACAKCTNGRGIAASRSLCLNPILDQNFGFLDDVEQLIEGLENLFSVAGKWVTAWSRLASRLARASKVCGFRRISLYSTRHAMIATAKRSLSSVEIAALAGHRSAKTAQTHYARTRAGFSSNFCIAAPDPNLIPLVLHGSGTLDSCGNFYTCFHKSGPF